MKLSNEKDIKNIDDLIKDKGIKVFNITKYINYNLSNKQMHSVKGKYYG